MREIVKTELEKELEELFDIKKAKQREERTQSTMGLEVQKDIKLITLMFKDGIPDMSILLGDDEGIKWDSAKQTLFYFRDRAVQNIESTSIETRIRMRPHLKDLVKKAKEFYSDC